MIDELWLSNLWDKKPVSQTATPQTCHILPSCPHYYAQHSSCRKETWVLLFLQPSSLLTTKPTETITFCESWWHPSLVDGLNHRKMEEVQAHQRSFRPDSRSWINPKAGSQVPAHQDENVAPNCPHMFQTKFHEWKMDLLPNCSLLAQPTLFQINPPPSSSISSVWSKTKQGAAPTETLEFSLPKEQAHEVEGNICWKLRCWNTCFSPAKWKRKESCGMRQSSSSLLCCESFQKRNFFQTKVRHG